MPLIRHCRKMLGTGVISFIGMMLLFGLYSDRRILMFCFIPLYFSVQNLLIQRNWTTGKILEKPMFYQSANNSLWKQTTVMFAGTGDGAEDMRDYSFTLPGRNRGREFEPGAEYIVYFSSDGGLITYEKRLSGIDTNS